VLFSFSELKRENIPKIPLVVSMGNSLSFPQLLLNGGYFKIDSRQDFTLLIDI